MYNMHNIHTCLFLSGDCDTDADCFDGLKCGFHNCPIKYRPSFDATDDCCYNPATTSPASFDSKLCTDG